MEQKQQLNPKRKNGHRRVAPVLLVLFSLLVAGYLAIGFYYLDGFAFGTWVNGLYCTGKSVEVMSEELLNQYDDSEVLVILYKEGEKVQESLPLDKEVVQADFTAPLHVLLAKQNPLLWGENLFSVGNQGRNRTMEPQLTINQELLAEAFAKLPEVQQEQTATHGLFLEKTEEGYRLVDTMSQILDVEKACEQIKEGLREGQREIDLTETDAYSDLPETGETESLRRLWEKVDAFQNSCGIVYDMGDAQIPLDASVVCDWIFTDEAGNILLDENGNIQENPEGIPAFINRLADSYDTYGVERPFQTTRGDIVMVKGDTYGTQIDREAEIQYLTDAFAGKLSEVHIPTYSHEALYRGKDDIGNTYIEVDMTYQTMYVYVEGELFLETPIVTGNMMRKMDTPAAVCDVYNKQRNRTLRGPNYASFVSYWMPVKGNIGIHDASWRKEFGGEIYKTKGSHGCINTPKDAMAQIYDKIEVGTPVVLFY